MFPMEHRRLIAMNNSVLSMIERILGLMNGLM
jgi:hypothetical protein